MKVREVILTEAPWGGLKGLGTKMAAGLGSKDAQARQDAGEEANRLSQEFFRKYIAAGGKRNQPINPDYVVHFLTNRNPPYPGAQQVFQQLDPQKQGISSKQLDQAFLKVVQHDIMGGFTPDGSVPPAPQSQAQAQNTQRAKPQQTQPAPNQDNLDQVRSELERQLAGDDLSAANQTIQKFAPGVSIVNQEPIIISYKNSEYGLGDRGEWVHLKTGKTPVQSLQTFLDQQHELSLG